MTEPAGRPGGDRKAPKAALDAGIRGKLPLVVYQWHGWDGFLIKRIAPGATMLPAQPEDLARQVLNQLPEAPGAFLFHIDCTFTGRFPFQRRELIAGLQDRGWTPCNEHVVDISKRALQQRFRRNGCRSVLAEPLGPGSERLIVKTNFNHGGKRERIMTGQVRAGLGIGPLPPEDMGAHEYRILPRSDIRQEDWEDPSLTIERFISNRKGHYFRASLAGNQCYLVRLANRNPIKKSGRSRILEIWRANMESELDGPDPLPDRVLSELKRVIATLDLDFGSLDVMLDDHEEPFVVDVNVTPWFVTGKRFPGLVTHLSGNPELEPPPIRPQAHLRSLARRIWSHLNP